MVTKKDQEREGREIGKGKPWRRERHWTEGRKQTVVGAGVFQCGCHSLRVIAAVAVTPGSCPWLSAPS